MDRSELPELHYIAPIENIRSILVRGILSNRRARPLNPATVAMREIQDIRAGKSVPNGRLLHDYANLYICARNPMLRKLRAHHLDICVFAINTDVLDLPYVVIADGNAASSYTAFWSSPGGLAKIDGDRVFAEYWTNDDQIQEWYNKRVKCAEVLIPDRVEPRFIRGAYVSCQLSEQKLLGEGFDRPITIDSHLFFIN
ncbi:MAG: DUF4433 domain-containing protein [Candidatus Hodarchaeota archaeon]